MGYINNHQKAQEAIQTVTDLKLKITNLSSQISVEGSNTRQEVGQQFQILATNSNSSIPPTQRLAILDNEDKKVTENENELTKQHELIGVDIVDLKTLRAERENRLALQKLQNKQAEIQRERAEIEGQQAEIQKRREQELADKLAQEAQQKENQKQQQEKLEKEKLLNEQCSAVFDYVVRTLFTIL